MTAKKPAETEETPQTGEEDAAPSVAEALGAVQKAMEELASLLGADSDAAKALKEAGRAAADNLAEARDLSQAGLKKLSDSVRRNPLPWLAAALGLGLIAGLWRNRGSGA